MPLNPEKNIAELLKGMSPKLNAGEYIFASIQDIHEVKIEDVICTFREHEGISIVIEREKADALKLNYDFIASWITLTIHSALDAVGLTAAFSNVLAKNQISCNVISGFYHDHIFVNQKDSAYAMKILVALSGKNKNTT